MAKHEVYITENTGATKESAPFLPHYLKKADVAYAALCSQAAAEAGLTDTQFRAILEGAFAEFQALEREGAVRIHVDGMTVCVVIRGSFPASDAPFDPTRNTLSLAIHLDDDIRCSLVNVTPAIVTEETATKVRVTGVADEAMPRPYEVIHGQNVFQILGYNLVTTDVGAGVVLENPAGVAYPCTVVEAVSKQVLRVKSAALLEGGDYKLTVSSRGGEAEGPLQTTFRKVKYLKVTPPGPTLTRVTDIGHTEGTQEYWDSSADSGQIEGTNLTGTTVKVEVGVGSGESMTWTEMSATASGSDTVQSLALSDIPGSITGAAKLRVTVSRDGLAATRTINID